MLIRSRVLKTEPIKWRELSFLQNDQFKDFSQEAKTKLKASIIANNFAQPFYVWQSPEGTTYCLDGKHRTSILEELVSEKVDVPEMLPATFIHCEDKKEAGKLVLIYSSMYAKVNENGLFDFIREYELNYEDFKTEIDLPDFDALNFESLFIPEQENSQEIIAKSLQEKFIIPPFSIFDSRQGYWQERKKQWIDFGIKSQESREDVELIAKSGQGTAIYELRNKMRTVLKREPTWEEIIAQAEKKGMYLFKGASIFDPVICEIAYRWFNIEGGVIIDPFAGGSVRGIVASMLGYQYYGIDLRPEQVEANIRQADELLKGNKPSWITGDSSNIIQLLPEGTKADFIFSCPPYADLEVYSDDSRDLSNMNYEEFKAAYFKIIADSVSLLKDNRFACFVVGDIRDKEGFYRNFVSDTISAFQDAGMRLYNEIILVNVAGSLPVRVGKQFSNGRKVGKMHQNILVFYKGNPKEIKNIFPEIKVEELEQTSETPCTM